MEVIRTLKSLLIRIWCVGQEIVTASRTPGMRRLSPPGHCRAPPPPRVDRARDLDLDLDNLDLALDLDNLALALAPPTPPPLPHQPSPAGRDAPCPDPTLQRGTGTATETPCRTCLRKIKIVIWIFRRWDVMSASSFHIMLLQWVIKVSQSNDIFIIHVSCILHRYPVNTNCTMVCVNGQQAAHTYVGWIETA